MGIPMAPHIPAQHHPAGAGIPQARFPVARRVVKGSPGLLSGDQPCKLIPEQFHFPIMVPW